MLYSSLPTILSNTWTLPNIYKLCLFIFVCRFNSLLVHLITLKLLKKYFGKFPYFRSLKASYKLLKCSFLLLFLSSSFLVEFLWIWANLVWCWVFHFSMTPPYFVLLSLWSCIMQISAPVLVFFFLFWLMLLLSLL